jgi:hypothetical protein
MRIAGVGRSGRPATSYIVLVFDDLTGEMDSYGPYTEDHARSSAISIQQDLRNLHDVDGVQVSVLPLEPPH